MQAKTKALNPQRFLEFFSCLAFSVLIFYLVLSGKYLSYVTPRMEPYLYLAAIVLLVFAFSALGKMFRPQHKIRVAHCFMLVIPILLFVLPHSPLNASNISSNYISGNSISGLTGQSASNFASQPVPPEDTVLSEAGTATQSPAESSPEPSALAGKDMASGNTASAAPQTLAPEDEDEASRPGLDVANKTITVPNDEFGLWLNLLYEDMQKYEGYTITVTGFVFNDPAYFNKDEFVASRLIMTCCVADLTPGGFLCKYDQASDLEADSWVTVEGTIKIGQYEYNGQSYDEPQLHVTNITPAEEVEGYVYPY